MELHAEKEKRKTTEEGHGCREGRYAEGWYDREGCWRHLDGSTVNEADERKSILKEF